MPTVRNLCDLRPDLESPVLNASVKPRRNIDCLDAFRGLAILFVFVFHYAIEVAGIRQHFDSWNGPWRSFPLTPNGLLNAACYPLTLGWVGVSLFFVISGFVIHYAFETSSNRTWRSYFRRRFWRIYPPYLIALLIFSVSGSVLFGTGVNVDWTQFVVHALLIHNFWEWSFQAVNPAFWSLAVECQFYLAYPLVRIGFRRLGPGGTLVSVLALSLLTRAGVWSMTGTLSSEGPLWLNPLALWFDWVLGAFVAQRFLSGQRVFPRPALSILLAGVAFFASTLCRPTAVLSFSFASVFAATVIDYRLHVVPWAGWRWVERRLAPFGLISYSLYLYHQPLIDYLLLPWRTHAPARFQPVGLPGLLAMPIVFLLIAGISYVMYRVVEITCIRIGRRGEPVRAPEAPGQFPNSALADIESGRSRGSG